MAVACTALAYTAGVGVYFHVKADLVCREFAWAANSESGCFGRAMMLHHRTDSAYSHQISSRYCSSFAFDRRACCTSLEAPGKVSFGPFAMVAAFSTVIASMAHSFSQACTGSAGVANLTSFDDACLGGPNH